MDLLSLHLHQPNALPSLRRVRDRETAVAIPAAAGASLQTTNSQVYAKRSVICAQQCALDDHALREQWLAAAEFAAERGAFFVFGVDFCAEVEADAIGGLGVFEVWGVYGAQVVDV